MRWDNPRLWIGSFSALGVLYVALRDIDRTSPGPLATVHERESELASANGCAQCHGSRRVSLSQACTECHEDVRLHIESGVGLHGMLEPGLAQACAACHSDHHGYDFRMVNERSFALAGFAGAERFEHDPVGFPMHGDHLDLDCTECHEHAEVPVLDRGMRRFMGLDQDCATCHEDPHEGKMARSCAECHGQHDFTELSTFVHDKRFPLTGSHARSECSECHTETGLRSIERLAGFTPPRRWRECRSCHESPHMDGFVEGVATLLSMTSGQSCQACHKVVHEGFDDERATVSVYQHAASRFTLDEPHDGLECSACHETGLASFEERYPGRAARECRQCHEDAHLGFFDAFAATHDGIEAVGCIHCHEKTTFTHVASERFDHGAWTDFQLRGAHAQNDCESCHPRSTEPDGLGRTLGRIEEHYGNIEGCNSCHTDPHAGRFEAPGLPRAVEGRSDCARCHAEVSFRKLPLGFDHKLWTGYRLTGAHRKASCTACHPRFEAPDENGRTWAPATGTRCADCHEDPHQGQFERQGQNDCARCHQDTTFFSKTSFKHEKHSRFPLGDAHRGLSCSACHHPKKVRSTEVVLYRPMGRECTDCHGVNRSRLRPRGRKR